MGSEETIAARVKEIAEKAANGRGLEFVHCQIAGSIRNSTVRVFIDKPSGVTVEDCADVSREMETILDLEDLIPSSYVLEVSSPGIERGLYSIGDFEKFSGQTARVKMAEPLDGRRNFTGTITGIDKDLVIFADKTGGTVNIPYDKIAKANLVIDLSKEFRKA
jgi:ribosome maturation factor RimP